MKLVHFNNSRLKEICVPDHYSVREAMAVMNRCSLRLVPVTDPERRTLIGLLADGDIRRYLADGGSVDERVTLAANKTPYVRQTPLDPQDARSEMQAHSVEYLPVTRDGVITDLFVLWAINEPLTLSAVIMAGGLGSRLAPYTDNCPKPLVELAGKPILTHIIEHLKSQGVMHFVLCLNYLGHMIVERYGDGSGLGVNISYVHEKKRLGTGGALSLIPTELLSEPFLSMNGDILTDIDVNALREFHAANGWQGTMVTRDFQYTVPYGVIRRSESGAFQGSDEKPTLSFPINAGIYMLSKSTLSQVPEDTFYDLPSLFDSFAAEPEGAGTFPHSGRWIDIGTTAELERARKILENQDL